jgi:hypothetical protein
MLPHTSMARRPLLSSKDERGIKWRSSGKLGSAWITGLLGLAAAALPPPAHVQACVFVWHKVAN